MPLHPFLELMRVHKPTGLFLLLWPTLAALWLAFPSPYPPAHLIFVFCLGVFVSRSGGCILNDLWDRPFDGAVPRTRERPLVAGTLTPGQAWTLLALLSSLGLILLLFLPTRAQLIAALAALGTAFYPSVKRFFPIPQLILGLTFNLGVLMAYASTYTQLPPEAYLLYLASIFWTLAYDTEYALCDREGDLKLGLHSSAIFFGRQTPFWIVLFKILVALLWMTLGFLQNLGRVYACGTLAASALMLWPNAGNFFQAFARHQWVGALWFSGIFFTRLFF